VSSTHPAQDCIEVAAEFLAHEASAVARALTVHVPRQDGRCHGCGHRGIRWPCAVAISAQRAAQLLSERKGAR
jgi:hypothetical protein